MNCQSFLNTLHEYLEDSLAPQRRQAMDDHVTECVDCRQFLEKEQVMGRTLSQAFRQSVQHLTLPPDFLGRLQKSLPSDVAETAIPLRESPRSNWLRLLWPAAIAACALFTSFQSVHIFPVAPTPGSTQVKPVAAPVTDISIQYSFHVPAWKFRRDGDHVVDTLSYQTVVVTGTLPTGGPEHIPQPTETKIPL